MTEAFVLDASALLCLLKGEAGTQRVITVLPRAWISAVALSEVYAALAEAGGSQHRIAQAVGGLHLRVDPFDDAQAQAAGMLRPLLKAFDLSLSDHACIALAQQRNAVALTTQKAWADLPKSLGITIEILPS